jgi:acetylornithine deacetylase/succinyl-diaminopimelate desuccinylase-like protein
MLRPEERLKQQAVDILRDLIRIDTTNPPGNEVEAARYLARLFEPAGIEVEVLESAPGRGNLVARLRGSGESQPLMLMGHLDVVAAKAVEWTHPPFAADIADGCIWGRGATDMKNMIAACAVTMLAMVSHRESLKRDILLLATADEEHGGQQGMGWLARNRPELFNAACALNEGGGNAVRIGERVFYTCQTAEKGVCRTIWRARGKGGHGSRPRPDIATTKLVRALSNLGDGYMQGRAIPTMREAMTAIAAEQGDGCPEQVGTLLDQGRIEDALRLVGFQERDVERTRPLFYDTASVTGLRAGDPRSINVIPPTADAYVDGRILPDQNREGFLDLLRRRVGDEVEIEVYQRQYAPGLESPAHGAIVDTIREVIAERCQGAAVIPWQCAGATDARHAIPMGVPVYGFVPTRLLPEGVEEAGAHANDERLWIENLAFSVEILCEIIHRFCTQV